MSDLGEQFTRNEGLYWNDGYPYCPVCWDTDRMPVRLGGPSYRGTLGVGDTIWICPIHKAEFAVNLETFQRESAFR